MHPASSASPPQCSTVCSDHEPLYAQIRDDLAQWDGITRDMIDRAMHRWDESDILVTLAIVNGTLWLPRPRLRSGEVARHGDPQLQATIRMILSILSDPALPTPPDLEYLSVPPPPSSRCRRGLNKARIQAGEQQELSCRC